MGVGLFKCAASVVNLLGAQIATPALDIVVGIGIRALRGARAGRRGPGRGTLATPPVPRATALATLRSHRCRQNAVGGPRRLRGSRRGSSADAPADCALGKRIIIMHRANALASPPPGLGFLGLVPRAPRLRSLGRVPARAPRPPLHRRPGPLRAPLALAGLAALRTLAFGGAGGGPGAPAARALPILGRPHTRARTRMR